MTTKTEEKKTYIFDWRYTPNEIQTTSPEMGQVWSGQRFIGDFEREHGLQVCAAVNNHEPLKKALQRMTAMFDVPVDVMGGNSFVIHAEAVRDARSLLASLEKNNG